MRIFIAIIFLSITLFIHAHDTHAAAVGRIVTGTIYGISGNPLEGVAITATCLGNPLSTTTDSLGVYSVRFEKLSHCLKGSTVTVIASKNNVSSTVSKKMGDTSIDIDLMLEISPASASVPEFGAMTGITAAGAGLLGFFLLKKIKINNT